MTIDVFISYAKEDAKFARRLAGALERPPRGWSVWWDVELTSGQRFSEEIRHSIDVARCVLVLWSKHSVTSDWVAAEADVGRKRGVLVPILIDDCNPPMPFGPIHSANLRDWRGSESDIEWSKMLDTMQSAFARGPEITESEREARQQKMLAVSKRQWRVRAAVVLMAVVIVAGMFAARHHFVVAQQANEVAAVSNRLRDEVLAAQAKTDWWWHLFDNRSNYETLENSLLVALEAVSIAKTPAARDALNDTYAQMPLSEHGIEIAKGYDAKTLIFSPDSEYALTAGAIGESIIWKVADASIVARIAHGNSGDEEWRRNQGWGLSMGDQMADINHSGALIVTAGLDNAVRLWNFDGRPAGELKHEDVTLIVRFSPVDDRVATIELGGVVRLWDARTQELLREWMHSNTHGRLEFSKSGDLLASVNPGGDTVIWDTRNGNELLRIADGSSTQEWFLFGPGERQVTVFGTGATVWDLVSGKPLRTIAEDQLIYSAIFVGDNTLIASGENSLQWWDHETNQRLFTKDSGLASRMSVDADSETLMTLGYVSGEAQAWDLRTGRLLRRIPYAKAIHAAAIDARGEWLAVTGSDWLSGQDIIEFARLRPGKLAETACELLGRNLSRDEWDDYIGNRPYRKTCPDADNSK